MTGERENGMMVYLVDMENIPHAWTKLLDACGAGDCFVLFYTEQISQVPIALMEKVTRSQAVMDYVKCHSGPNGLDFQLVTEMGFRIARDPEAEYAIVSQDHGFDVVVDYWADRGVRTRRVVPAIGEQGGVFSQHGAGEFEGIDCSNPQCIKDFLCWKLSNKIPKREIPFVASILMEAMAQGNDYSAGRQLSCRFTYLDRALRKLYGDAKGAKIRDQIKAVSREVLLLGLPPAAAELISEEGGLTPGAPEELSPAEAKVPEEPASAEQEAPEKAPPGKPEAAAEASAAGPKVPEEPAGAEREAPGKPSAAGAEAPGKPSATERNPLKKAAAKPGAPKKTPRAEPRPPERAPAAEAGTPEPPAAASPEPANALYARLLPLGLTEERAKDIAGILSDILQSRQEHPRATVYRQFLSAFGRKEGTALYQTVRETAGQILLERRELPS